MHGAKIEINVKVANDETVTFMSSTFVVGLERNDGRVDTTITAQSSKENLWWHATSQLDKD